VDYAEHPQILARVKLSYRIVMYAVMAPQSPW